MEAPPCCPQGSWGAPLDVDYGAKSVDAANGESFLIGPDGDLEVYVAKPTSAAPDKVIVVFTDVFGLHNRLFAMQDKMAKDVNAYVVSIDCFRGETKNMHLNDLAEWIGRHPYEGDDNSNESGDDIHPVRKDIEWCLDFLSRRYGVQPSNVGAVGFCWGVWAMTKAISMGVNFKCGVGFHPTLRIEDEVFKGDQLSMARVAAEKSPLLFCVAGNDLDNLKPPNGEVSRIISESKHDAEALKKRQPKCIVFEDQRHGWVSRGDTANEKVRDDAGKALTLGTDFLSDWMM